MMLFSQGAAGDSRPAAVPAGETAHDAPAADDFAYHSPTGAHYLPTLTVVARGTMVPLIGTWRDDRRGFTLTLGSDGTYSCQEEVTAGAASSESVESGQWSLDGGKLQLVPASVKVFTVEGFRKRTETRAAGSARSMTAEGLTFEYTPYGDPSAAPRRVDGLAVEGQVPGWSYSSTGQWKWELRRAR